MSLCRVTAQAPDGYTLSFYLAKKNADGDWDKPKLQLGTKEEREKESEGLYTLGGQTRVTVRCDLFENDEA